MNGKVLRILEYGAIREKLASLAGTTDGRNACLSLAPLESFNDVLSALRETSDAIGRLSSGAPPSFFGVTDIRAAVSRAEIGGLLSLKELLCVAGLLGATASVKSFGRRDNGADPDSISCLFDSLEPLTPLRNEICRCIVSEEEVSDDASPALSHLRRSARNMGERIRRQLNAIMNSSRAYLSDSLVTMRDGRYCLPVRMEYRHHVHGLVHGHSSSGSTAYIEPVSIVSLNNGLCEIAQKEKAAIEDVIRNLSLEIAQAARPLVCNYSCLVRLDFIFAKAAYSKSIKGTEPLFNAEGVLDVKQARHPLIDASCVVPIDIRLGKDFTMLVITGPNTGGKTVTLKTIGLLCLMGQSGLFIPAAEGSLLAFFDEIFADIGDEQSIEQSLSTFSSHMVNIVRILEAADKNSLVLLDELGAGTDPAEGAALAAAILHRLRRLGVRTAATTHYSELKIFALSTDGVENACCEFDIETLKPTYKLLIGLPGKSNAFAISSKLGLPDDIINEAREGIGRQAVAFEDVISDLEEQRRNIEADRAESARLRLDLERREKALSEKEEGLLRRRDDTMQKAREEAAAILRDSKDIADRTIRNMRKHGLSVGADLENDRALVRQKLDSLYNAAGRNEESKRPAAKNIEKGDRVRVISMNLDGTVMSAADSKGRLTVQMGSLTTQVAESDVVPLPKQKRKEKRKPAAAHIGMGKTSKIGVELNLIGKTTDEAIPMLEKYLDDAYLAHLPKARIIHGRGTGALRDAVRGYLSKSTIVKQYRQGEFDEGGYGVTVVTFKE